MPGRPAPEDAELIAGCLAGRRESWDLFVGRFSKLVHWSIRKTLAATEFSGRQDLCEEIFQDFFRGLLEKEKLGSLREVPSLAKFLTVSSCRAALDRVKALSRRRSRFEPLPEDGLDTVASGMPAPDQTASTAERDRVFQEVFSQLSVRERSCFELHYLDGLTHREVGEKLSLPQDTVSTILRRTKEKLRSMLEERGMGPSR